MSIRTTTVLISYVLLAVWLANPLPASADRSTARRMCGSCGLAKTAVDGYHVVKVPLGAKVASWSPVDLDKDGRWELAISFTSAPVLVGIFDAKTLNWVDGPRPLPVLPNKWDALDADSDGNPEYVYSSGSDLRIYDVASGADAYLRSETLAVEGLVCWGEDEQGIPIVAALARIHEFWDNLGTVYDRWWYRWNLYRVSDAGKFGQRDGSPGTWRKLRRAARTSHDWLVVVDGQTDMRNSGGIYGAGSSYWQDLHAHGRLWTRDVFVDLTDFSIGTQWIRGVWGMDQAALAMTATGDVILVSASSTHSWAFGGDDCLSGTNLATQTKWVKTNYTCVHCSPGPTKYAGIAAFDLDNDQNEELLLSLRSGAGWEVRNAATGVVLDTLPEAPVCDLRNGPITAAGANDLFYLADSSLYIYSSDVTTGVFDDPEGPQHPVVDLTLMAHPNPFNSAVTLAWSEIASVPASITIYNVLGQSVFETSVDGRSEVIWDGCDSERQQCPSGIYIARLTAAGLSATTKIVLLR